MEINLDKYKTADKFLLPASPQLVLLQQKNHGDCQVHLPGSSSPQNLHSIHQYRISLLKLWSLLPTLCVA